jgi:hypothetical protein
MGIKTTKYLNSRKFLNRSSGVAAIETTVEITQYSKGDVVVDAGISISDCNKRINLEFGVYEKKDVAAKLAKIDLLISEFTKFRAAFKKAADNFGTQPTPKKKPAVIKIPK